MQKRTLLFFVLACLVVAGCRNHGWNGADISFSENKHYYSMKASFSEGRTKAVERYMDAHINDRNGMSFVNTSIDGVISFDDRTSIYIKKYPGYLHIKLDKEDNSTESYRQVKAMCLGIKDLLTR